MQTLIWQMLGILIAIAILKLLEYHKERNEERKFQKELMFHHLKMKAETDARNKILFLLTALALFTALKKIENSKNKSNI